MVKIQGMIRKAQTSLELKTTKIAHVIKGGNKRFGNHHKTKFCIWWFRFCSTFSDTVEGLTIAKALTTK